MNMPKTIAKKAIRRFGSIRSSAPARREGDRTRCSSGSHRLLLPARLVATNGAAKSRIETSTFPARARPANRQRPIAGATAPYGGSFNVQAGRSLDRGDILLLRRRAGIDIDDDAEAGAQPAAVQHILREDDADRYALDHLGEIARGIFSRQQREDRAGGRRDRLDGAGDRLLVEGIHVDIDLRARNHVRRSAFP